MHFKLILKYFVLPVLVVGGLVFAVFHKSIVRYLRVSWCFDTIVSEDTSFDKAEAACNTIIAMGAEAEPYLLEKAKESPKAQERKIALYLLGNIKSEAAVPLLLRCLTDNNELVRLGAIQGLKYMMRPEFVDHVGALIRDPSPDVRMWAAESLGKVPTEQSAKILARFIQHERNRFNVRGWYQAWMSYTQVMPADGVVSVRYRVNDTFEIVEDNQVSKAMYTYYFLVVKEPDGKTKYLCVPMDTWDQFKENDRLVKPAGVKLPAHA